MADKREALLDAAEAVLVEGGLAGATVDQITARAGVAKGTFYLYFRTKDEVVHALKQRLWDQLMEAAAEAAARIDRDDLWGGVDAFIETVIDFDIEHREWHRLVGQGWSSPYEGIDEQQMIAIFEDQIRRASERGVIEGGDPALTAVLLYRAVEGTSRQCCLSDEPVDRDRLVEAIKWFIRRVLEPRGERAQ